MALFKIFKGNDISKLNNPSVEGYMTPTDGYAYYNTNNQEFYIDADYAGNGTITRKPINAHYAYSAGYDGASNPQKIDATYIKEITISSNQLSYTKGDGSSQVVSGTLGAVTGVKGSNESSYRTGNVNITAANIGLSNVENTKLSTWAGTSNITTIGTLSSGTVPWANLSNIPNSSTTTAGIIQIGSGATNAAAGNHTHTTTIDQDNTTSTNQLTLAFGTKYKLTAGGTSYIFTMPSNPNTNTASAVDNILDGSNSGTAITYAPYTSQQTKLSFDTSTTNPTRTNRLNLNGYLYATKLYSDGKEVLTAHQSLANYKTKQTEVSTATAETTTATRFVYSITQNDNGEITVKTRPLPTYNNYVLPTATTSTKGGVVIGSNINVDTDGKISINSANVIAALGYTPYNSTNPNGYTNNVGTITGIKMNGASKGTSGVIDLGTVITDVSGKLDKSGGTMTGDLTLKGDPTSNLHAATKQYVDNILTINDALVFKGVLGTGTGMISSLPPNAIDSSYKQGWTYKVGTAGTYAGQNCEIGDTIYCITDGTTANNANWTIIQTNIDGTVIGPSESAGGVAVFTGTTGKAIKDSGFTIATNVPENAVFTDTDTKVTSAANHYTPSTDTNSELTASLSGTAGSYALNTEYTVLTGVKAQRDAKGHITGLTYTAQKIKDTNTTYTFDGAYNASTNKVATVSTITNAINALDGNLNNTTAGSGKTLTAFSQTNGIVSATFGNISITKSQVSDFPTSMPASDVFAWAKASSKPNYSLSEITGASDVQAIEALTGTSGLLKKTAANTWTLDTTAYTTNTGTVTSIATGAGLTGGTITGSGTIKANLNSETSLGTLGTTSKLYAVGVDVNGKLAVSVPWTDTKVTSSANHYTPSTASGNDKTASASGATAAWDIDVVKGVTLNTDGKGHVTGISVTSGKIPGNPNTDRYVNSISFTDDTSSNANSPVKLTLTRAGSDTVAVTGNLPKVSSSSAGVVPKGASVSTQSQSTKFLREDGTWAAPSYTTNTWRGIQNNLTSDSTTDSLSAAQGKALKALVDGKTSNTGTVTSVAASGSGGITISDSPITTSGTITVGLNLSDAINELEKEESNLSRNDYIISESGNEVNGSVATFEANSEEPIKKIIVDIELVQSGNGDPSPTNVRPISGWTAANVMRTGKNLWGGIDFAKSFSGAVGYSIDESTKTFTFRRSANIPTPIKYKPLTPYTIILTASAAEENTCLWFVYTDGSNSSALAIYGDKQTYYLTSSAVKTVDYIRLAYNRTGLVTAYYDESGIFEGALSSGLEPYIGTTAEYTFPSEASTVYGGTLTINDDGTGVLASDYAIYPLSDFSWAKTSAVSNSFTAIGNVPDDMPASKNSSAVIDAVSDIYTARSRSSLGAEADYCMSYRIVGTSPTPGLVIRDSSLSSIYENFDETALKQALAGHYIVYRKTSSALYNLTTNYVKTFLGTNNIWADCGDINVVYTNNNSIYKRKKIGSIFSTLNSEDITNALGYIPTDTKQNIVLNTETIAYITGVTTTPTSTTAAMTGIADTDVYLTATAGQMNAKSYQIDERVVMQYDSTLQALEFAFI